MNQRLLTIGWPENRTAIFVQALNSNHLFVIPLGRRGIIREEQCRAIADMNAINYIEGILTEIQPVGRHIIVNICNEVGIWSSANSKRICRRWPQARSAYMRWYRNRVRNDFSLGAVQFVRVSNRWLNHKAFVANLIAQTDTAKPIRYKAFEKGLLKVSKKARCWGASVHLQSPTTMQSDSWPDLEYIISRILCVAGVRVHVYCFIAEYGPQQVAMRYAQREAKGKRIY